MLLEALKTYCTYQCAHKERDKDNYCKNQAELSAGKLELSSWWQSVERTVRISFLHVDIKKKRGGETHTKQPKVEDGIAGVAVNGICGG